MTDSSVSPKSARNSARRDGQALPGESRLAGDSSPLDLSGSDVTYRNFKDMAVERLAALYPPEEARSIAVRLLTARLNVPPYKIAAEPATLIPAEVLGAAAAGCGSGVLLRSDEKVLASQAPLGLPGPGSLSTDGKNWIQVRCGSDVLRITELQVAGKKRMDVASFLLGFRDLETYRMA